METRPEHIKIEDYSYFLPPDKIAKHPLKERDTSKLLVYRNGRITQNFFSHIFDLIPPYSLLVKNNTRVIQARILFAKNSGARIEVFCLEPFSPADYESNFTSSDHVKWKCLVGNSKKWKTGLLTKTITIDGQTVILSAEKSVTLNGEVLITFSWNPPHFSFSELLNAAGSTPIPPYLNRSAEDRDREEYQTIYAQFHGSVAAPTAGLHFSDKVLKLLETQHTIVSELTLHVGAGTFTPVKEKYIAQHHMHTEHVHLTRNLIHDLLNHAEKGITAVGTTSLRSLESLYWLGVMLHERKISLDGEIVIDQWLPYNSDTGLSTRASLLGILIEMNRTGIEEINFLTRLIIIPGYKFRVVDQLITNFHQPNSTLLLLVAAFIGGDWKKVYNHALENNFRFLSYGDSSILLRNNTVFNNLD